MTQNRAPSTQNCWLRPIALRLFAHLQIFSILSLPKAATKKGINLCLTTLKLNNYIRPFDVRMYYFLLTLQILNEVFYFSFYFLHFVNLVEYSCQTCFCYKTSLVSIVMYSINFYKFVKRLCQIGLCFLDNYINDDTLAWFVRCSSAHFHPKTSEKKRQKKTGSIQMNKNVVTRYLT